MTPADIDGELHRLYRIRRGLRAVLTLPVGATVAGNVIHAQPTTVGRIIAAWAPTALLIAVEILTRTPSSRVWTRRAPLQVAMLAVIGVAAWVSYGHLYSVCLRYGEDLVSARILPLSVDGLIVVITVKLVEINARIRELEALRSRPTLEVGADGRAPARPTGQPAQDLPAPVPALPAPPDDPGIDPIAHLGTLRLLPPEPPVEASAQDEPAEDLPDPDPLLPGIRAELGCLPKPPGRILIQRAAERLGESIGSSRADRIKDVLAAEPWPPARDLPAPARAGQTA